jgi:hypothetical protein
MERLLSIRILYKGYRRKMPTLLLLCSDSDCVTSASAIIHILDAR